MTKRFERWVDRHKDRVFSFACYSLGNKEEAEDVTQEVLIRLWKNREDLDEQTLPAWIGRVTRNACIDVVRRRQAYTARIVANGDTDHIVRAPASGPGPEEMAITSEFHSRLRDALAMMQEPHRSIVILREIQDMRYDQISETLDLPLNTVKSYLHRGRRMLRELLTEMGE